MPVVIKVSHLFLKTVIGMLPLKTKLMQTTCACFVALSYQHSSNIYCSIPVSTLSATWFTVSSLKSISKYCEIKL